MKKKILIILGHPARNRKSFCESLALSYKEGAETAGHEVEFLKISGLSFDPILHEGYQEDQEAEPDIIIAQNKLKQADHWVIIYPLWQFMVPALLKGFFERTLIKGFAYDFKEKSLRPVKPLKGKTARIIQTMGMPGFFYRLIYKEHGEKAIKSMLTLCGIHSRCIYCGTAETSNEGRRKRYLDRVRKLGRAGQ